MRISGREDKVSHISRSIYAIVYAWKYLIEVCIQVCILETLPETGAFCRIKETDVGKYGIPQIVATHYEGECEFIPFNMAKTCNDRGEKGVHFFLDDYQFSRLWSQIEKYKDMLAQFNYVMSPDYSTYTDFPMAMQIYNHYRKHWVGAYLQDMGVKVIPSVSWSTPDSFEWCFDGEPRGGAVAVSSVGCMNSKERRSLFLEGFQEMIKRLEPESVLFHGFVPDECREYDAEIFTISTFQTALKARCATLEEAV